MSDELTDLSPANRVKHFNEIYGKLNFLGLDSEGKIYIILEKESTNDSFILKLKLLKFQFEGENIVVSIRKWRKA